MKKNYANMTKARPVPRLLHPSDGPRGPAFSRASRDTVPPLLPACGLRHVPAAPFPSPSDAGACPCSDPPPATPRPAPASSPPSGMPPRPRTPRPLSLAPCDFPTPTSFLPSPSRVFSTPPACMLFSPALLPFPRSPHDAAAETGKISAVTALLRSLDRPY